MSPEQCLGLLGFPPTQRPTLSELKRRWLELCKKHHPDTGGDPELFLKVTHAYRLLTDASYRQSEMEAEIRRGNRNIRGDLNVRIVSQVSFEDAFFGRMAHVSFNRQHLDQALKPIKLEVADVQNNLIQIPAGSTGGYEVIIQGGGHKSGHATGDAVVSFIVQPHPRFTVQGTDVIAQEKVPLAVLVKGGKLEVQTMYGTRTARVKAGSKNGDLVKVKKCGVAGSGSHVIVLEAVFPTADQLRGEEWRGLAIDFTEDPLDEDDPVAAGYISIFGQLRGGRQNFSGG